MKNIFKKIINKFKTVYCEDCKNAAPNDHNYGFDKLMCLKQPLTVDCTSKADYITEKRKCIVHSYYGCKKLRSFSFCLNYEPKG